MIPTAVFFTKKRTIFLIRTNIQTPGDSSAEVHINSKLQNWIRNRMLLPFPFPVGLISFLLSHSASSFHEHTKHILFICKFIWPPPHSIDSRSQLYLRFPLGRDLCYANFARAKISQHFRNKCITQRRAASFQTHRFQFLLSFTASASAYLSSGKYQRYDISTEKSCCFVPKAWIQTNIT